MTDSHAERCVQDEHGAEAEPEESYQVVRPLFNSCVVAAGVHGHGRKKLKQKQNDVATERRVASAGRGG